jgi:hypothetical protein
MNGYRIQIMKKKNVILNYMCGKIRLIIPESEVKNIMYRRYYMENLCSGNCNKK